MESIEKEIIWGVVGAGSVCEVKSAPALYQSSYSSVNTVMCRTPEKAADFALRHGINQWTTNFEDLLTNKDINAIYIATPPDSHAELTIKAAKAGKAVYVEKPMARTHAECLEMIEACRQANVPLYVAYYRRSLPGFLKVKELIEKGQIGEVRFVNIEICQSLRPQTDAQIESNWRVKPEIAGGGYFHDLASHTLDYLDFLFGSIVEVNGLSGNQANTYAADDIVTASFRFQNGVYGTGLWCFNAYQGSQKDSVRIVGSKGEISFSTFGNPMLIRYGNPEDGFSELTFTHDQPIQQHLVKLIVAELRGNGSCPSNGESAARTAWAMERMVSSAL